MRAKNHKLLTQVIHPMEIRLKGVEKDVEHLDKSVDQLTYKIDNIDTKMDVTNVMQAKQLNTVRGGFLVMIVIIPSIFAFVEWIFPLLQAAK